MILDRILDAEKKAISVSNTIKGMQNSFRDTQLRYIFSTVLELETAVLTDEERKELEDELRLVKAKLIQSND